jgi:hypothetical protein
MSFTAMFINGFESELRIISSIADGYATHPYMHTTLAQPTRIHARDIEPSPARVPDFVTHGI